MKPINLPLLMLSPLLLLTHTTAIARSHYSVDRWDGLYVGAQLGEAWNHSDWEYANANYFNTIGPELLGNDFDSSTQGFIGGGYLGYLYSTGPVLLGAEASFMGADLNTDFASPFFSTDRYTVKLQNFAAVRGRITYPYQDWMLSLNGGWAGANLKQTLNDPIAGVIAKESEWVNGWTVGAELDYKFFDHYSIGIAYDYIRFTQGDETLSCNSCGVGVGFGAPVVEGTMNTQLVTARVAYFFE